MSETVLEAWLRLGTPSVDLKQRVETSSTANEVPYLPPQKILSHEEEFRLFFRAKPIPAARKAFFERMDKLLQEELEKEEKERLQKEFLESLRKE